MSVEWSDERLRPVKRALSIYEKETLISTQHKALIMPGAPPKNADHLTEIEELIQAGFQPAQIVGVERDSNLAEQLYNHYFDSINLHLDTIEGFVERTQCLYSYAHFDFCGCLLPEQVHMLYLWRSRLAPVSRVRISVARSRRTEQNKAYETILTQRVTHPLLSKLNTYFHYDTAEVDSIEITDILSVIVVLAATYGISALDYADSGTDYIPPIQGTHQIVNLRRFHYNEPTGQARMSTIWCDLIRMDQDILEKGWGGLHDLCAILSNPAPSFNNPDLYRDKV